MLSMPIKRGQQFEVTISGLAIGGKGLAKIDGLTVFVDQGAPLDRALIQITRKRKRYAEARLISLLEPSPLRVTAPCEYSGFCGGCKWQFLRYDQQLHFKRQHVSDAIKHIGGINDVMIHPAFPSDAIFGYRNKMEFSCSDRRWLLPHELGQDHIDADFALGLHVPGTFYKVLDTKACLLQPKTGNLILEEIRAYIKNSTAKVYGLRSHQGFWRFIMLRNSPSYERWMVNIITATEDRNIVQPLADRLAAKFPAIDSVINNVTSRKAGVAVGEYEICLAGSSFLRDQIGPFVFEISSNSFFQTNTRQAAKLYEIVKDYAHLTGRETVFDLYSGTGTIAIYLSTCAQQVIGMEISASAMADAQKNCSMNAIENCHFILGDIKKNLSEVKTKPDVLIIDPPRMGMHKDILKQVIEISPRTIVYVSCNPATLARDLAIMQASYQVVEVQPVDMFPHTFHIEAVTRLEKRYAAI
jgi:23S rRNA (uracil1939-C5)-methyltransferase